jgi:glycerophosphoryl diester phosphodiesterase
LQLRWRAAVRPAIALELWSTLIFAAALLPATGWVLNRLVAHGGQYVISDHDLFTFALSVPGITFLVLSVGFALLYWHLEQAGLLLIVLSASRQDSVRVSRVLWEKATRLPALLGLGLIQGVVLLVAFLPVGGGLALIRHLLLSEFDFYYYFTIQPPVWWAAVALAAALGGVYLFFAVWLYLRLVFAIPGIVVEGLGVLRAVQASWRRTRGHIRALGLRLAVCWGVVLIVLAGASWIVRELGSRWLDGIEGLALMVPAILTTLGVLAAVEFVILVVGKITHVSLVAVAYLRDPATLPPSEALTSTTKALPTGWIRLAWVGAGIAAVALAVGSAAPLLSGLGRTRAIEITGHRGNKNRRPENTLSAIELAIAEGADFAEIDVQTAADGVVVLLHDDDLRRVAGDRRRLRDLKYRELRDLDVGSWFDPAFHAERVPTLQQVIDAVRGRIRLNIELKYTWDDPRLAAEVVRIIRENEFASECVVSSLNRRALLEVEASFPELETGLIMLVAVGNPSRIDADFLSIGAARATPRLVRASHRRGRGVHVWTVSDRRQALSMIEMDVDNIITDEPRVIRSTLDEWNALSRRDRLALMLRKLILDPEPPVPEEP